MIWLLTVFHGSQDMLCTNPAQNLSMRRCYWPTKSVVYWEDHTNRWPQHTNTRDNVLLLMIVVAWVARPLNWRQGNIPYFRVVLYLYFHLWRKENSGNLWSVKWYLHLVKYLLLIMKSVQIAIIALNLSQKPKISESIYCKCNTDYPNCNIVIVYNV